MADPTIQTFCCHHGNGTDMAVTIMEEFNTDAYNSVCILSSVLGIFGALYQIMPRQHYSNHHRWLTFSAIRGRKIIVYLSIADLLAALGVCLRSIIWISYKNIMPSPDDDNSVIFCAISSALTQYFYTATWIWTLCYAIDMRLVLCQKESKFRYYHVAAWGLPAITTVIGLSLLYIPDANCHTSTSLATAIYRILPNYIVTYVPITTVMLLNPYFYHHSIKDMERIITTAAGQFTSKERDVLEAIKIKFCVINIVFYICWIPNLINGILLWTLWFHLPDEFVIIIWYIMAFLNPLQAVFNCLVYRSWSSQSERVVLPWKLAEKTDVSTQNVRNNKQKDYKEESYPLLRHTPVNSINVYNSLSK